METYCVFKMYVPFHDSTFVPAASNASTTHGEIELPHVDAIAARGTDGKLWLEVTNVDPNEPAEVRVNLAVVRAKSPIGETLTAFGLSRLSPLQR
jgi:alpha-N-arabinofuranosidase